MIMLYAALTLYTIIFIFTWMHLMNMINDVCESIQIDLNREIGRRRLAGEDLNYEHMLHLADIMVKGFRKYSLRHSVLQNFWMCFFLVTCTFSDNSEFEEEFKREFKNAALLEFLREMKDSPSSTIHDFVEIVNSVSREQV